MAARKRRTATTDFERNLRSLEKELPAQVRKVLRQMGKNLREAQRQLEAARAERDARWNKLQKQMRKDATQLVRQLREAVSPPQKTRRARPTSGRARRPTRKK
jgi:DNA-binding protein H-NS